MVRSKLLLPVNENDVPDWDFMESYIKLKEKDILETALPLLNKRLTGCKSTISGG